MIINCLYFQFYINYNGHVNFSVEYHLKNRSLENINIIKIIKSYEDSTNCLIHLLFENAILTLLTMYVNVYVNSISIKYTIIVSF